jgi:hypothetical protein
MWPSLRLEMLLHSGTFPYIMNIANKKVITSREDSLVPYYVPFESPALTVVRLLESYSGI